MKITPVAQGTGTPGFTDSTAPRNTEKIERAKAIAAGEEPVKTGDAQVDRTQASIRKIKMKTNVSTNRDNGVELSAEPVAESPQLDTQSVIGDTNEQAQGTEETKPLSPQFAALAKTKRALQVKERELAAREAALKSQPTASGEDLIAKLKANPLSVLQEAGVTYDQLTEAILNNQSGTTPEINALKSELKALKEELTGQFKTRDELAEQQVLGEIKRDIVNMVNSQPEQYEAIKEAKAYDDVKELIHRTWKQTGEILDTTEAAELVENQLIEEALPFARIKKVQSRLTPAQEQMIAQIPIAPKSNTKVMRTLTNRDSASPIMDRRARAIAAMNGTLKKG